VRHRADEQEAKQLLPIFCGSFVFPWRELKGQFATNYLSKRSHDLTTLVITCRSNAKTNRNKKLTALPPFARGNGRGLGAATYGPALSFRG